MGCACGHVQFQLQDVLGLEGKSEGECVCGGGSGRRSSFDFLATDLVTWVASDGGFSGVCSYWPNVSKG